MKAKWKNEEIKKLFDIVEKNQERNLPIIHSFKEFGILTNRNPLSVRNFYYAEAKLLAKNKNLQKEIGVDISKHSVQKFEHFNSEDENKLKAQIDKLKASGYSTRRACFELSNGDISQMLRLQNKYRNIKSKTKAEATVIEFPKSKNPNTDNSSKNKLSDDDIKSLFMGLVKLVKENANNDNKKSAEKFLEETEKQNRRRLVEITQLQSEIQKLKQQILCLHEKNKSLSTQLENYRINYVQTKSNNNNANY